MHRASRHLLLLSLTQSQQVMFTENCNKIANSVLLAIPTLPSLTLKDSEFHVALNIRSLHSGISQPNCWFCLLPLVPGHDEACKRPNLRTQQHEQVKKYLAHTVSKCRTSYHEEPFVNQPNSGLRADLLVTGPAAPNATKNFIDISITSVLSLKARRACDSLAVVPGEPIESLLSRKVIRALEARVKVKNLKYKNVCEFEFAPIIISSGGTLHLNTRQWFSKIHAKGIPKGVLRRDLGMILLRTRAVNYQS